jgi:hypothetical protein
MSRPSRVVSFGSAALAIIAGIVSAAVVGGGTGQILALVLIGIGLVVATSLVFLEVGLSEDRDRARESKATPGKRPAMPTRGERPRLQRSRGHRRRLR